MAIPVMNSLDSFRDELVCTLSQENVAVFPHPRRRYSTCICILFASRLDWWPPSSLTVLFRPQSSPLCTVHLKTSLPFVLCDLPSYCCEIWLKFFYFSLGHLQQPPPPFFLACGFVEKAGLKYLIPQPPHPECWDWMCVPPCLFYVALGIKPRT